MQISKHETANSSWGFKNVRAKMLQLMLDNREIELRRQRDQNEIAVRVSRRKLIAELFNHLREN